MDHFVSDSVVTGLAPQFLSVLAPYKTGEKAGSTHGPLKVERVDCGKDAVGWLIKTAGGKDFAWLRGEKSSGSVSLPGGIVVETDAAFVWLSLSGRDALISRGTKLSLKGQVIIAQDASKGFLIIES